MRHYYWRITSTACVLIPLMASSTHAQTEINVRASSAAEALQLLLDNNSQLHPGGPLRGDGSTIVAAVLTGESLTFPVASSSGAFVTRKLNDLGPQITVASTGSFGPLFAERGFTNGRGNLSVTANYQHISWGSLSGIRLQGNDLVLRHTYGKDISSRPQGTVDENTADIKYATDVYVLAVNYGLLRSLDVGFVVPYIRSEVRGSKEMTRADPKATPVVLQRQNVSGVSTGVGDLVFRAKYGVPLGSLGRPSDSRGWFGGVQVAVGADFRVASGDTASLKIDCNDPTKCKTESFPDIGLGKPTQTFGVISSATLARFSPHVNLSRTIVPAYQCPGSVDQKTGCKGTVFGLDKVNLTQDAKRQSLADEWSLVGGVDYQLVPYAATLSFDVIGRQLIRAGQFNNGPARVLFDEKTGEIKDQTVISEIESRHGNLNTVLGTLGAKVKLARRLIIVGNVLFPLNKQGLQPNIGGVVGLEWALLR